MSFESLICSDQSIPLLLIDRMHANTLKKTRQWMTPVCVSSEEANYENDNIFYINGSIDILPNNTIVQLVHYWLN